MRVWRLAWLAALAVGVLPLCAPAADLALEVTALPASPGAAEPGEVTSGALDGRFAAFDYAAARRAGGRFWLKLSARAAYAPAGVPVVVVHTGRQFDLELYARVDGRPVTLPTVTALPRYRGAIDRVFLATRGIPPAGSLYLRVTPTARRGSEQLGASASTLDAVLAEQAEHARMIAITVGALLAMSFAALAIRFLLSGRLMVLYASLFILEAIYLACITGEGFEWPLLRHAVGLVPHAWNVPVALCGALSCLFAREITDLRHTWRRAYVLFGWLAVAFVALACANVAREFGFGGIITLAGNVIFLATASFTLFVMALAWRQGNRSAGWFLLAWGLLEAMVIATSGSLLARPGEPAAFLLYYCLPLSMVAAAVLVALSVADRLREERRALSEAERQAQIDPLTGVLNRRSLIERLEAASLRAQARGLPISVLFIDVDHFKRINDTYGHLAGDACLRAIVGPIQGELRQSDTVGRYGGEEFVVVLSSAGALAAHPVAERIVQRVRDLRIDGFGAPIQLTCSIGVAASDTLGVWGERLVASADAAVYAAKHSGRNRVQIAEPIAA